MPSEVTQPWRSDGAPVRNTSWWVVLLAVAGWYVAWWLTPGLLGWGVGHWFTDDSATAVAIETALAAVVAVALVVLHRQANRVLFARSRMRWLYVLPIGLGIALPFHYTLPLPVALYMVWMTVSVFWQDYLTFGLLQCYLRTCLPGWAVLVVSAVMFWSGHLLFLPNRFGVTNPLASLAILVLGFTLAGLRLRLRSIHLILAVHLAFYFLFA
jgi:hypothetical protein